MTLTMAPSRTLPRLADATHGVVVCLATGPSLTQADVDYVHGKATVIAVNDAHRLAPWADVLYSSDRFWWKHYRGVPSFAGLKVGIEHSPGRFDRDLSALVPDIYQMRNTGHDGVELEGDGLRTCRENSGGAALNLAVHLGATDIVLLGYDMGDVTGKRHFFGEHPAPINGRHNFPTWRAAFRTMTASMKMLGVRVVNCTRTTSLDAFDCQPLEDVL